MNLNDFYLKALGTLSLEVDEEGYVTLEDKKVTVGKKFLVMATSKHVSTMDDNKVLFNPLQEDSIKGINPSMVKYKAMLDRQLSITFNIMQKLLAKVASDVKLQKDASLEINKFVAELNKLRRPNMKEIVTEDTIKLLDKIHMASYEKSSNAGMVTIAIARAKVLDGEKFNKVASLALPVYEDLLVNPKYIYDIELKRSAEAGIFKIITEYIFGKDEDGNIDYAKYTVGSNSLESPTFISVYKTYVKIAERFNKILKQLSFLDKALCKKATLKIDLEVDDLVHIESFKGQLRLIPKIDTNSSVVMPSVTKTTSALPATNIAKETAVKTAAINPAAPMSAMQRKLLEMRGQLPAASVGYGAAPVGTMGISRTASAVTYRAPGTVPVMDPNSLSRANALAAAVAARQQAPVVYGGYQNQNNFGNVYGGNQKEYVPYMRG